MSISAVVDKEFETFSQIRCTYSFEKFYAIIYRFNCDTNLYYHNKSTADSHCVSFMLNFVNNIGGKDY